MPTHSTDQIPPRNDNWKLSDEPYMKDKRYDYEKAWSSFREQFRSQQTRDITGRANSFNAPLDKIDFNNVENPNKI